MYVFEFETKYNISYKQKDTFSGGNKTLQKAKYIKYKSREGVNENLKTYIKFTNENFLKSNYIM